MQVRDIQVGDVMITPQGHRVAVLRCDSDSVNVGGVTWDQGTIDYAVRDAGWRFERTYPACVRLPDGV